MKKVLIMITLMLFSLASLASRTDECATSISELKTLVGNSAISLNWKETTNDNPLSLKISNSRDNLLRLKLATSSGEWADVTGVVCKKGVQSFEARVNNIVWGQAAPSMVKGKKLNSLSIKLPYDSLMKVSIKMLFSISFEFAAI